LCAAGKAAIMRGTQCYRLLTWTPARPCYKANLQSTPLANLALTPTLIASCARAQTADGRCAGGWCARARHGGVLAREGHRVLLARGQTADAVVPGGCLRWVNQAATLLPAEAAKCALPGAAPCCCSCEGTRLGGRQPRLTFPHFCRLTVSVPIISPSSPSLSPSFPHFWPAGPFPIFTLPPASGLLAYLGVLLSCALLSHYDRHPGAAAAGAVKRGSRLFGCLLLCLLASLCALPPRQGHF